MTVLFSHIRTGKWASIMPINLAESLGFIEPIRAIPIVEPDAQPPRRPGCRASGSRTRRSSRRFCTRRG